MSGRDIAQRLQAVRGSKSFRRFATPIGVNHETLRRYMHHGRVPASVVARIAVAYGIDCNWLLTGRTESESPLYIGASTHKLSSESTEDRMASAKSLSVIDIPRQYDSDRVVAVVLQCH